MSTQDPWIGRTVGWRYLLSDKIGEGGMGSLYRARDLHAGGEVALKVLLSSIDADPVTRERFQREASALQQLRHPSIVEYRDHGADDGIPWLVMELLVGETLAARMRRGPSAMPVALGVAIDLARALERCHAAAILHRDIKPPNVFVTADGVVKLLDFGVARLLAEQTLTARKEIIGTVRYMAPEQCDAQRPTAASDLYSLGVVLFEMIVGRSPFKGSSVDIMNYKLRDEAPRMSSLLPSVSPLVDDLVARLLRREAHARPPGARLLAEELSVLRAMHGGATSGANKGGATTVENPARYRILHALDSLRAEREQGAVALAALELQVKQRRDALLDCEMQISALEERLRAL